MSVFLLEFIQLYVVLINEILSCTANFNPCTNHSSLVALVGRLNYCVQ